MDRGVKTLWICTPANTNNLRKVTNHLGRMLGKSKVPQTERASDFHLGKQFAVTSWKSPPVLESSIKV